MIGKAQANRALAQWSGPGHWNDPDMLEVGNGGMTATEYRTHFSLWAIMAAPLLIGSDLRSVGADTFAILKNTDVIAVDQDPLGRQGVVVSNDGAGHVVYAKALANGDRAVALSNETTSTATIATTASAIGLGGSSSYNLKDLWSKTVSTTGGAISASVGGHATVMYRVSRTGTTQRLEAEQATASAGTTIDSNWSGFSGTGFTNTTNATGSYVQFTVTADAAGPATLTFDYAATSDRPATLAVNGAGAGTLAFPSSGAWSLWKQQTANVNLNAGSNTIRLTATSAGGVANHDSLDVTTTGGGGPGPGPVDYQAEDATIFQGVVESNHAGYTGTGFVNGDNAVGSGVEFAVTASSAGPATVTIRFANGTTADRPMTVSLNGAAGSTQSFPGTGAWTTWNTVTLTLNLLSGTNTIRLTSTTAGGGPNLDRLTVG
jgi:alpha-galactosidase